MIDHLNIVYEGRTGYYRPNWPLRFGEWTFTETEVRCAACGVVREMKSCTSRHDAAETFRLHLGAGQKVLALDDRVRCLSCLAALYLQLVSIEKPGCIRVAGLNGSHPGIFIESGKGLAEVILYTDPESREAECWRYDLSSENECPKQAGRETLLVLC